MAGCSVMTLGGETVHLLLGSSTTVFYELVEIYSGFGLNMAGYSAVLVGGRDSVWLLLRSLRTVCLGDGLEMAGYSTMILKGAGQYGCN